MYIKINQKQIALLKKILPSCRINAYDIETFQSFNNNLNNPIESLPKSDTPCPKCYCDQVLIDEPSNYTYSRKDISEPEKEEDIKGPMDYFKAPSTSIDSSKSDSKPKPKFNFKFKQPNTLFSPSQVLQSITPVKEESEEPSEEPETIEEIQHEEKIHELIEEIEEETKSEMFSPRNVSDIESAGIFDVIDKRTKS